MYRRLRLEAKPESKLGTTWLGFLKVFSDIVGYNDPKWKGIRNKSYETKTLSD